VKIEREVFKIAGENVKIEEEMFVRL